MTQSIIMIVAGFLAAPKLFTGKSKHAQELLEKLAPYQGWIGLVIFGWGVWSVISFILSLGVLTVLPVAWWVTILAIAVLQVILGLLLGYNLINKYVFSKNAQAAEKAKQVHAKLIPKQTTFGVIGMIVGVWGLVGYFLLLAA